MERPSEDRFAQVSAGLKLGSVFAVGAVATGSPARDHVGDRLDVVVVDDGVDVLDGVLIEEFGQPIAGSSGALLQTPATAHRR